MNRFDAFWSSIKQEFPDVQIIFKDESRLMSVIDIFLRFITFGVFSRFLDSFITTIGHTIYVPRDWINYDDTAKIIIVRHERVHMRQERKYGPLWFRFLYLFVLPTIFTYRAKFEREAYEETFRAHGELLGLDALDPHLINIDKYIENFTGPNYFFMWPRKRQVTTWAYEALEKVRKEIRSK